MEVSSASPALAMAPAARRGETLPAVARPRVAVLRPGMGLALPSRLPFERWLNIGMQLSAASTSVAWCLGDWLAFGERAFAGHYRQAVEATCLDYQTLRNYARVARRFGMSRRRDTLSFGHHAEVAALAEPEQDFWLRKAEAHNWSVKQLRRQVRPSLAERSLAHDPAQAQHGRHDHHPGKDHNGQDQQGWAILRLRITPGQLAACQAAAHAASLTLHDWATLALAIATPPAPPISQPPDSGPSPAWET